MTECVPADIGAQASGNRRPLEVPLLDFLLVVGFSSGRIGKDPIVGSSEKTLSLPFQEKFRQMLIQRHAVTRVLGFHLVHSGVHDASLKQQCHFSGTAVIVSADGFVIHR